MDGEEQEMLDGDMFLLSGYTIKQFDFAACSQLSGFSLQKGSIKDIPGCVGVPGGNNNISLAEGNGCLGSLIPSLLLGCAGC